MEHALKGSGRKRLAGLQYQHALGAQASGTELETVTRASICFPFGEIAEERVSEEGDSGAARYQNDLLYGPFVN